jgi:8-oxo-dGTP pyrophosphatase MutT (NUDIX family)
MGLNRLKITKHASVIVLYDRSSDSLILEKRSEILRSHPGEVCFPGGRWEKGDSDLYTTALRELYEELGIISDRITLIKKLRIQKTHSGRVIHPWFATIDSIIPYTLNSKEVTRLILIPMYLVQSVQNYKDIVVTQGKSHFKSCEFEFKEERIWGATAKIMKQLIRFGEKDIS